MDGDAEEQGKGEGWQEEWRRRLEWRATKRAMPKATKRVMATDGDSTVMATAKRVAGVRRR